MAKLPLLSAKEIIKILNKLGFRFIRQEEAICFLNIQINEQQ